MYAVRDKYPRRRGERMRWWLVVDQDGQTVIETPLKYQAERVADLLNSERTERT